MLKKILRLLSKDKLQDSKLNDSGPIEKPITVEQKLPVTAKELKDIGDQFFKDGDLNQAELSYRQSLDMDPNQPAAYNNRGIALYYLHRLDEALASYNQAIVLNPDFAQAYSNQGIVLNDMDRLEDALVNYERAIALKPDYAEAYYNRGISLNKLKRTDDALASYDQAIALKPDYAEAYYNRGLVFYDLNRFTEALASYDYAIKLNPNNAEAYNNRGVVLNKLKRYSEALASYNHALVIRPNHAETYNNRGTALSNLNRLKDALIDYNLAIALNPNYAEACNNRGLVFYDMQLWDKALSSFDQAILLDPDYADAYYNRGVTLNDLNRLDEALVCFNRAITLMPDHDFLYGYWLHNQMHFCCWNNYDNQMSLLASKIESNEKASVPFVLLALSHNRALQKRAAELFAQSQYPLNDALPPLTKYPKHNKIRIGYFSADFRIHPVSFLTAELFEVHDRSKFELIAFYFGPDSKDEMTKRIEAAFDQFIDVRQLPDQEVALLARKQEIDIAIDLGGYTTMCRTGIFALRAAPIQVSYLGYLGTMGAEYMDYLIADTTMVPQDHQKDYTEKIIYLPNYQVNDTKRIISDRKFTRQELGLPRTGFVFCCLNNNYKITPDTFDLWMRILKQVEHSVLWLLANNETIQKNLRAEASKRGIDAERLVFAKNLPLPEYLARYRIADLFLDTSPYNAGTTASDALWAGLPVLTYLGETFAGRMAASLLHAIHLPELITSSPQEYEALAITLATNPEKLSEIKQKLAKNRLTTPLFNTHQFSRNIESAYTQIYERYQADLKPEHIYIKEGN